MQKISLISCLFLLQIATAQIKGKVTDTAGNPIPYVSIYIENTYNGTTSNEKGNYELSLTTKGKNTIVFQNLGYKTLKKVVEISQLPYLLDVVLEDETYNLKEIVVQNGINPANEIIRNAIKNRKTNNSATKSYEADFYSKGIFRVANMPKKILGQEIGDMDGNLDTVTRSGVLYLSETVSKIMFEHPDNFKEKIIASKISGQDNGFSYNTALGSNINFYENLLDFKIPMISPIADNAFNYYTYELESTFYEGSNLINKIKLKPKRDKEPVFEGYIFIVENTWAIYGIDVIIKGYRMQEPFLETMNYTQQFSYNESTKVWAKNMQAFDFKAGAFGINFTGKFTHVFRNYVFKDGFQPKTFTKEIVSFEENANKKGIDFWNTTRPVALTDEEVLDYKKKDSIQTLRKSEKYLDSIDAKNNKFKIQKLLMGYSYQNSYKKYRFSYDGLGGLASSGFNTVQGYYINSGLSFRKWDDEKNTHKNLSTNFNYGFAEDKLRITAEYYQKFNNKNDAYLKLEGGSKVTQFNVNEPISPFINTLSTLFFKDNYSKLYAKDFAKATFGQELFNGFYINATMEYAHRKPLENNTNYSLIKKDKLYTSNDPQNPENYTTNSFASHHLTKFGFGFMIRFGQKYISRPDGKINLNNDNYPSLTFNYQKGMFGSSDNLNFDKIVGQLKYNKSISNKGELKTTLKAGKFLDVKDISFIDYQHFNGNETHILTFNSAERFNLLPYYSHSTNNQYLETHIEHDFKGYILNKIPLLNKLQWNTIVGYHQVAIPNQKPYQEFSIGLDKIGFGKYKFLRIDYVKAYNGSQYIGDGFMFGLKF